MTGNNLGFILIALLGEIDFGSSCTLCVLCVLRVLCG